jgi:oxaloacetate decarboxylase beta subunit
MRALTTPEERAVKMEQARAVSKTEKIIFPILVATFVILLLPSTAPLIGCLMFGNLLKETGVTDRLSDTSQNAMMNIVTIFLTSKLAPHLLGGIAVAAYSYMALIPMIQPPFMRMLTSKKERQIKMIQTRTVSKTEKIIFPIVVTLFVACLLPDTAPLIGCLMLGNLFKETGLTDRLSDTVQNALMNIVTILLSTAVGATMVGSNFLTWETIKIVVLGVCAFILSTVGGLLAGKVMCWLTKGKVNPLIGSAGVSAVPMAARVANMEGQKANPSNFLLMHAMGPNVAGVIGSAIAAGFLLKVFG